MHHIGTEMLETENLVLRRYKKTDAEDMFANWVTDPEVTRFWGWEPHKDISITKTLLSKWIQEYENDETYHWVIENKENKQAIGYIYLNSINNDDSSAAVHYLLSRKYWNKGFMTEACKRVIEFAFCNVGFLKIWSYHHCDNPASGRVMQKCDMMLFKTEYMTMDSQQLSGNYHYFQIERQKYLEDFEYLYQSLKEHPIFLFEDRLTKFDELYNELYGTVYDYSSLVVAMTKLTMYFEDGHTNIELPYAKEDLCLKMKCYWNKDRLYLAEKYKDIDAGAEILGVEGANVKELITRAALVIPHENLYLVKSRMLQYPYMNYHIFSEMNLLRMFGTKMYYSVLFDVAGKQAIRQCELEANLGYLDFNDENKVSFEIKGNTAVLHLDECIYDEKYKYTLKELAVQCREKIVDILELDLSKNMGGSSAVIDEFIKYINIDMFRRYEMIDCTDGVRKVITSRSDEIENLKAEVLFPERIVCTISNTTFSSAKTFAVTLKDNGIAEIVGEPSGGKPSSYGMPKRNVTPNYKVRFRVSRCLFLRPDVTRDDEQALFPDNWKK